MPSRSPRSHLEGNGGYITSRRRYAAATLARMTPAALAVALATPFPTTAQTVPDSAHVGSATAAFWDASNLEARDAIAAEIVDSGIEFETVFDLLREGRHYSAEVETGVVVRSRRNADGTEHLYALIVPDDYDPARPYPVRVYLHGGVSRPLGDSDGGWWRNPGRVADSRPAWT